MTSPHDDRPVVLAVDDRGVSPAALAWAADRAVQWRVPLQVVHSTVPVRCSRPDDQHWAHHRAEVFHEVSELVGRRHSALDVVDDPFEGELLPALRRESHKAQLLVLAARPRRLEGIFGADPVAVPLSARAACPVAVVPSAVHAVGRPPHLVVGVCEGPSADSALDYAFEAAARTGAELHALWIWEPNFITSIDEVHAMNTCRWLLADAVRAKAPRWPGVRVVRDVARGRAGGELLKASRQALAVIVGRGNYCYPDGRLGAIPRSLIGHAQCPVLTAPALSGHAA